MGRSSMGVPDSGSNLRPRLPVTPPFLFACRRALLDPADAHRGVAGTALVLTRCEPPDLASQPQIGDIPAQIPVTADAEALAATSSEVIALRGARPLPLVLLRPLAPPRVLDRRLRTGASARSGGSSVGGCRWAPGEAGIALGPRSIQCAIAFEDLPDVPIVGAHAPG